MVQSCYAFNCTERYSKGSTISFHRFPTDPILRNKWMVATKRDYSLSNTAALCSNHFLESDFDIFYGKRRLKIDAVPSVFQFSKHIKKSKRRTRNTIKDTQKSIKSEMLTKDRYQPWLEAIGRSVEENISSRNVICSRHFSPEDFIIIDGKYTLKKEAVPNLRLSQENTIMDIQPDPLAISSEENLALFGGSMENIEFVVESDEDGNEMKDNTVLGIVNLEKQNIEQNTNNKRVINVPCVTYTDNQIIDLDALDVKDEVEIVEMDIKYLEEHNKLSETIECDKLENVDQDCEQKICCYVPGCTSGEEELYWFNVPIDANLMKMWDICIGRVDKRLTQADRICHKHFSEQDVITEFSIPSGSTGTKIVVPFDKPQLKKGAVPCMKFHEECCVPTCRRTNGRMYYFPVLRTSDFHLWLYMVKNPIIRSLSTINMKEALRYRVCELHFDADCFDKDLFLKRTAAPTLHIPANYPLEVSSIKPDYEGKAVNYIQSHIVLVCAYGNCPNRSNSGKNLFRFPTDGERCIAWLQACGRLSLITSPLATVKTMSQLRLGVCEDHFDPEDFQGTNDLLRSEAVPRTAVTADIRKPSLKTNIAGSANASNVPMELVDNVKGVCDYRGCQSVQSPDNPFFSFPTDKERSLKWLEACQLIKIKSRQRLMQLCRNHFDNSMFDADNRLKDEAIPISYNQNIQSKADDSSTLTTTNEEDSNKQQDGTLMEDSTSNMMEQNEIEQEQQSAELNKNVLYCAIENCPNFHNVQFARVNNLRFPRPNKEPQRFNIWLLLVANPKLKGVIPRDIANKYMVCMKHFEPHFFGMDGKANKLSLDAVPTKNLTEDSRWFFTSEYYKTMLQYHFEKVTDSSKDATIEWREDDIQDLNELEDKRKCVLEADRIRFPGMGYHLYMGQRVDLKKRKVPYNVYNYYHTGYGLNNDVEVGESIKIHTAIIIDDDDDVERQVLQQLLDKRRKNS